MIFTQFAARCALVFAAGFLAPFAGYAAHSAATPAPASCSAPSLPSGDAMRAAGGQEYVCTDGTWIPVRGYGVTTTAYVVPTPAAEWHACHTAEVIHRLYLHHRSDTRAQFWAAWNAADRIQADGRRAVHHFLLTGSGWVTPDGGGVWPLVCNPDA